MAGRGPRGGRLRELREVGENHYEALIELDDGRLVRVEARVSGDIIETPFGSYYLPELEQSLLAGGEEKRSSSQESWLVDFDYSSGEVRAKLPVKIVSREASIGDEVEEGQVVILVETMKMVNEVHAPCRGKIEAMAEGQSVGRGGLLFKIRCTS